MRRAFPLLLFGCLAVALALEPAAGQESGPPRDSNATESPPAIPSFAELESAGAQIGEIRVDTQNIFDLQDPQENGVLYRAANALHVRTRREVIADKLLFKTGDRVSLRLIEETERLLRTNRFLYDVHIRPIAYHNGVVDIEVRTRDTWTLQPGISFSRSGGSNRRGTTLVDTNALGTGILVSIKRASDPERTTTEYRVTNPHAFDGWTTIDYSLTQLSDGLNRSMSVTRPFYALDTHWAAGFSASRDSRVDSRFGNGVTTAQFRDAKDRVETYGGWSRGLVDGWVHRYSLGLTYQKDIYSLEPGLAPPDELPSDQTIVAPFVRYEIVQDDYAKLKNLDLIERPEYLALGFQSSAQIGRAFKAIGSTQDLWLYSTSASDGFRMGSGAILLVSASTDGQSGYGPTDRRATGGSMRYYSRADSKNLLFVSLAGDILHDASSTGQLLLGGDTGLRGYPRNFQSGNRRELLNVERRVYTDWYPFRLFRVGGAVFYDLGRAWSGPFSNTENAGWHHNVGLGLRILSARSSFGNVLHIDFAVPLNRDPNSNIKPIQVLVSTKVSL